MPRAGQETAKGRVEGKRGAPVHNRWRRETRPKSRTAGKDVPELSTTPHARNANPGRLGFGFRGAESPPRSLAVQIRAGFAAIDPGLAATVELVEQHVSQLAARPGFNAPLLTSFALAGVVPATIRLYGLMSLRVARRTRKIGVRMALGATRRECAAMV
jgi:hypothetical protein